MLFPQLKKTGRDAAWGPAEPRLHSQRGERGRSPRPTPRARKSLPYRQGGHTGDRRDQDVLGAPENASEGTDKTQTGFCKITSPFRECELTRWCVAVAFPLECAFPLGTCSAPVGYHPGSVLTLWYKHVPPPYWELFFYVLS